ncbi:9314_t:CDS:2, partial [Funneliformis geosporum]
DPNDWLIHFEKAAKANNWTSERALEIVGGFLEGMAADWYKAQTEKEDVENNEWNIKEVIH